MAATATKPDTAKVPVDTIPAGDEVGTPAVVTESAPDRAYAVIIGAVDHEGVDTTRTDAPVWIELGTVVAATKPEGWEKAKEKWPELVPPNPASKAEADAQAPVRCKLIPSRYWTTIESRVEYVPPRAVAKGL